MFKYEINSIVYALREGRIVEGSIKERRFIDYGTTNHIVYIVDFYTPEDGRSNESSYEPETFASLDELVLNLVDIYYLNKDDLA